MRYRASRRRRNLWRLWCREKDTHISNCFFWLDWLIRPCTFSIFSLLQLMSLHWTEHIQLNSLNVEIWITFVRSNALAAHIVAFAHWVAMHCRYMLFEVAVWFAFVHTVITAEWTRLVVNMSLVLTNLSLCLESGTAFIACELLFIVMNVRLVVLQCACFFEC